MSLGTSHRTDSSGRSVSFAQERFWFLDQINPADPSANICRAYRIKGELKPDVLKQSLQAVVNRHESLRTTFATRQLSAGVDSKPVQLVATNLTVDIALFELSLVAPEQRQSKAQELARAAAQRPFDLTLGPLFRVTLLKLAERDHVLVLNLHRIVCDERSVDVLLRDWTEHYRAILNRTQANLGSLPLQFADFAARQHEQVNAEEFQVHRDYWQQKLSEGPVVIELPTTGARPAIRSWRGESLSFEIEKPLYEALKSVSGDHGVDLFTALTAAFQLLISRYSGQHDVVVGSTIPNREVAEMREIIGPLANSVALRTDLSGNPTFGQLLNRVKEGIVSAVEHSAMPFEKLIDELEVERSLSHAPVFQVAINLKEEDSFHRWSDSLSVEEFGCESGIAALDLSLDIVEASDHLNCRFEYASDLFDRRIIKRMADHFVRLLDELAKNPDERTGYFTFLSPKELNTILREWNNTATPASQESFCESFESQVKQTPEAVAIQFGETSLTYAELNQRANQLAHYLKERGAGPDKLVGLFLERSLELVVALLGTLKAGGAYLPLDISYPPERLSFMLEDATVPVLLTQEKLLSQLPKSEAEFVCLDRDHAALARQSDSNPTAPIRGENVAYVIYTSGSTGKPKGVQVTHSALANLLSSMRVQPAISASDTLLSVTTLSFDIATLEVCLPLTVGARVVIARREEAMDAAVLARLIEQCGATLMQATPATWRLLLAAGWKGDEKLRIISGGEPLTRHHADQLLERTAELWNQYGPTETTIYSTVKHISSTVGEITIGKPIANTQLYILDPHFQPVPIGATGELCIAGDGLARGYLRRRKLTAERFVPNPFSTSPGQRMYRTGDLARFDENGEVELLGRLDHQVKLRGYRIELGEIESVLNSHPDISQSVVTVNPDSSGEQRLTGYFVPDQTAPATNGIERQLRDHLRARLPEYMVPQNLVMLEALPLTPNGKIDRRLLPKPETFTREGANYFAPRDNLEKQVAAMWEVVLGIKPVGSTDNFFELGGHSLLAARLFAQIENRLGKHVPLATLFQAPTVEQLCNVLRGSEVKETWSSLVPIQTEGSKPPLFCIHAAGANVLIYRPLSRHLGTDQPIYALQAQGLDGQTKPYSSVEEMAAHYIGEMRAFQPEGPYHLVGASFGGLVIYEMALQLSQKGQKVGFLAMLNTNCPSYTLRKRIASHAVHLIQEGPKFYARGVIDGIARRLGIRTSKPDQDGSSAPPDPEIQRVLMSRGDVDEALVRTVLATIKADESYVPKGRITNKIIYFRAIDAPAHFHDNRLGWRRLTTGGFEVYDVPGTHTSMREEPRVAELVKKLKPCLERAQLE